MPTTYVHGTVSASTFTHWLIASLPGQRLSAIAWLTGVSRGGFAAACGRIPGRRRVRGPCGGRPRSMVGALTRARLEIVGQVDAARFPHRGETGQASADDHGATADDEGPRVADDRRCCALRQEEHPEHGPSPLRHEQTGDA